MKLKSLSLKGFGPYTEETVVRFPEARKVSIHGNNGAGKTFLLDAVPMALFKTVPNRTGGFYDQFSGNDAVIELVFDYQGAEYKARRLVNAVSRTQKAFLFKDGLALNDGKESSFAAEIGKLGITELSFLAAVYQTQNGVGSALSMDTDSRIKLLSEILNLREFERDHEKVVARIREVQREIDGRQSKIEFIRTTHVDPKVFEDEIAALKTRDDHIGTEIAALSATIEQATQAVADARANAQGVDELRRQRDLLTSQNAGLLRELSELERRIGSERAQYLDREASIRAASADAGMLQAKIDASMQEIERLNEERRAFELRKAEDRAAVEGLLNDQRSVVIDIEVALQKAKADMALLETSRAGLKSKIDSLRPQVETMDGVPCNDTPMQSACQLLAGARTAKEQVAQAEIEFAGVDRELVDRVRPLVHSLTEKYLAATSTMSGLRAQFDEVNASSNREADEALAKVTRDVSDLTNRKNQVAALAALLPNLEGSAQRVADWTARTQEISRAINSNSEALISFDRKIEEASSLEDTIRKREAEKSQLAHQLDQITRERNSIAEQIGLARRAIERALADAEALETLKTEAIALSVEIASLDILREGLGPRGAKNVKIDAAGKAISQRANTLLRIGLGPQFTLKINTLKELQSKDANGNPELRETLELRVINNDTAEEILIENLSGGEKAMVGLVFSLAMAVELREASGIDVRTLLLDEPSAGLSEENSIKYLAMLDAVLDETGIDQVFFISHMPAMQSLADATIRVIKDGEQSSSRILAA